MTSRKVVNTGAVNCDGVVVNELLCFLSNKSSVLPPATLVQLCLGMYNEEEIDSAKRLAFDLCADSTTTRYRKRQGTEKDRHNIEDILKLMNEKRVRSPLFCCTRPEQDEVKLLKEEVHGADTVTKDLKPRRRLRLANVFATRFEPDVTKTHVEMYLKKYLPDTAGISDLTVDKLLLGTTPTLHSTSLPNVWTHQAL